MDTIVVQLTQWLMMALIWVGMAGIVLFHLAIAVRSSQSSRRGAWLRPFAAGDWLTGSEDAVPVLVPVRASGLSRAPPMNSSLKDWPDIKS